MLLLNGDCIEQMQKLIDDGATELPITDSDMTRFLITLEDGVEKGGFGSAILEFMGKHNYKNKVKVLGIQDHFVEHGTIEELQKKNGIDISSIKKLIRSLS